jgi:ribosomal protein S18 acetylase RimI-like enzyme
LAGEAPVDLASLDHPQWAALTSEHAGFARRLGRAAAYPSDVTPMSGLEDPDDPQAWADLVGLLEEGERSLLMFTRQVSIPEPLRLVLQRPILQMIGPPMPPPAPPLPEGLVALGPLDAPDMVELAKLTEPGPMGLRTVTMGHWFGIRREGRLVAMAGQRMHLTGLVEVSGVCTHPSARGQGLARDLILHVMHDIATREERSFLHLKTENAAARGLYEALGFEVRTEINMSVVES